MANTTNNGLTFYATLLQSSVTYVAVGLGAGTLSSALTSGSPYTSLGLAVALVNPIGAGQSLTLLDSTGDTQVVTVANPGALAGATSIPVVSFNASANFPIGTGVVNTPAQTDSSLQNETFRLLANPGTIGSNAGEFLCSGYFDPTTPAAQYMEVGWFGGTTASATLGTGVLI